MEKLSERIRYYRKQKKFSQKDLAEAVGSSQPTINNYEKGVADNEPQMSLFLAIKLANALDVPFNKLFQIEDITNSEKNHFEKEILKLQEKITDLEDRINEKNSLIEVLNRENITLRNEKARKTNREFLWFWLEDERKIRESSNEFEKESLRDNQTLWIRDLKDNIEKYYSNEKILTLNEIFEDFYHNVELVELIEEDSKSFKDFVTKTTQFFNLFISIKEKEIERLLEKNKGFKKTLPFKDKF